MTEEHEVSATRVCQVTRWRVYSQLLLNLPRRSKRSVPTRERQLLLVERRTSGVWALDFMRDALYNGKVFRTFNVIDEVNGGALGIDISASIPASRVIAFLAHLIEKRAAGCPQGDMEGYTHRVDIHLVGAVHRSTSRPFRGECLKL